MMILLSVLNLLAGLASMGLLGRKAYIGTDELSLNEQMIEEGYAGRYDGGTKQKRL